MDNQFCRRVAAVERLDFVRIGLTFRVVVLHADRALSRRNDRLYYGLGRGPLGDGRECLFFNHCRIQKERGHTVQTGGPYQFVRHPGYVGALLYQLATPFLLGSWWALVPMLLTIPLFIIRTALEDKLLHNELDGYRQYATRVRYRLLPGVW